MHNLRGKELFLTLFLSLMSTLICAQEIDENIVIPTSASAVPADQNQCPPNLDRPCIGLVLGGGGARGGAHVGVLKALEERGIPVDIIVGTSIGSFVGGLYSTGKSADEIRTMFLEYDWNSAYRDDLGRSDAPNRRKRQMDDFPVQMELGFDGRSIKLPRGLIQGEGMKKMVDEMLGFYPSFGSFNDLPIPFRAVSANLETGEAVVLEKGDLATALQISMSLPGVLRPIELDGHTLVDGGIANNLPVDIARSMGAEIIIAVDIGSQLSSSEDLSSGLSIMLQLTGFLTRNNVAYQKSLLTENDILIEPKIEGVTMTSFTIMDIAVEPGYIASATALDNSSLLQTLKGIPPADQPVSQTMPSVADRAREAIRVDRIALTNKTRLADDYLLKRLEISEGASYTPIEIQAGIDRLYGQGTIARIYTTMDEDEEGNTLDIEVQEKEWGPGYLDFKLAIEDDYNTLSRYQIGASYRLTNLSPYNAEWFVSAEIGTEKFFNTELYWPLGNSDFYWDTTAAYSREKYSFLVDGDSLGEVSENSYDLSGGIGWNITDRLDVVLSGIYSDGDISIPTILESTIGISDLKYDQRGFSLRGNYDSLDHPTFPTEGWKISSTLSRTRDEYLDIDDYSTLIDLDYNGVISLGRHNLRSRLKYQSSISDNSQSLLGSFQLGGFLNLSGVSKDDISGLHVRFASLVYTYELAENDFGAIQLPLFLGASLETGNAWQNKDDIDYSDMLTSASMFIGWKSPLGPAYLAYGRNKDLGDSTFYLFLGHTF